jgi:hypothetical protein
MSVDYDARDVGELKKMDPRDEYSIGHQLEALSAELGMLQDMITQAEKKFAPVLIESDTVAAEADRGMDRRQNSPVVDSIISSRDFVRGQTQRLMYLVERAQV